MRAWGLAYDAAEIALHHAPSAELIETTRTADLVLCSDLPRAIASAAVLAPGRPAQVDARLRETPLEVPGKPLPSLYGVRLPLRLWGLVFGLRWFWAWLWGGQAPGVDAAVLARAEEVADWLASLAATHARVVVVTHGFFRRLVGQALERRGWKPPRRHPYSNWSAWTFTR